MNGGESTNSQLTDAYGRTIDYLRVSITDRCNLRCLYCMPPEGIQWIPHDDVLRFEEILRICRILAGLGIRAVRITGGEPLVRRGVPDLVRELKAIRGIERVSMTSNGVLLGENLEALAVAGLDAVNISLDTLNGERYRLITLRDDPGNILSAVNRALELGLEVKINCVPLAGINEDDIVPLAGLAKDKKIPVRFIELMPLGAAAAMRPIPADRVISLLEAAYGPLKPADAPRGNGPAEYFTVPGFAGRIGLIRAMSHCFCGTCNRLRLGSSGLLRPCLSSDLNLDLRGRIRANMLDSEIAETIREFVTHKPAGHHFTETAGKPEYSRTEMFRIGG